MKRVEVRKRLIETYKKTNSVRKTAKLWKASRNLVRKWVKSINKERRIKGSSRRPKRSLLGVLMK